MNFKGLAAALAAAISVSAMTLTGCSGGGDGGGGGSSSGTSSTKTLTVSGTFASAPALLEAPPLFGLRLNPTMAASTAKVRCVTLAGTLVAGEGNVSSASPYTFSLSFAVELNAPIGCFVLADDSIVATLTFGSGAGLDGSTKSKSAYSPKPDSTSLDLGSISVTNGIATAAAIVENGNASKPAFADMNGQWTLASVYTNAQERYLHPCDMDYSPTEYPELNASCKANWSSMGVYVHQISAIKSGSATRYGLALWQSSAALAACSNKEGVDLESGWSEGNSWTQGSFNFATLDMSNITSDMLNKARFKKSIYNNFSNCPKGDDHTTELSGCNTATACGDFNFNAISDGETRSMEKARCVANALASGNDFGYQWGTSLCGARARINWNSGAFGSSGYKNDGTGCVDSECDAITFQPNDPNPQSRLFFSEMFLDGNVGTAAQENSYTCHGAVVKENVSITVTQTSSTTATFVVEFSVVFASGSASQKQDCLDNSTDTAEKYGKVTRMKLNMQKQ